MPFITDACGLGNCKGLGSQGLDTESFTGERSEAVDPTIIIAKSSTFGKDDEFIGVVKPWS